MTATGAGPSSTEQAKSTAQDAGQQVKERAQEGAQQARGRVRDEVDRRSTQAGEQLGGTADAIRGTASQLREQGNEPGAKAVERAAGGIERAGSWLRDSDGDRILGDVEDFGRRNPLAVVAAGVALGFAASRLLKASSRTRYESRGPSNGSPALPRTGATTPAVPPTVGTTPTTPETPVPPGSTAGTRPASWQGGLGGEAEGARHVPPPAGH